MYYISGVVNNLIYVTDTSDGVTEALSYIDLVNVSRVTKVGGTFINQQNQLGVVCTSNDAFKEFISKVNSLLAKMKMMDITDKEISTKRIYNEALKYGFVQEPKDLAIDTEKCSMVLRKLNKIYTWEHSGDYNQIESIDVCNPDVVKLSRLGLPAFKYMYLTVGGKKVSLDYLVSLLVKINRSFDISSIKYIGITPSNKMFKFVLRYTTYSVKFDTIDVLKRDFNKILNTKVESAYGFDDYVRAVNRGSLSYCFDEAFVTKMSEKSYSLHSYRALKEKYKTLQDVFIAEDFK